MMGVLGGVVDVGIEAVRDVRGVRGVRVGRGEPSPCTVGITAMCYTP